MKKRSKRYRSLPNKVEVNSFEEAIDKIKAAPKCGFDEGMDVSFNLKLLKKHSLRDVFVYPHAFGPSPKVAVFAKDKKAEEAKQAGADYVGSDDLVERIQGGWLDFKVAIATPDMMKTIAKIARILGTKGLMPNPKSKTVTEDVHGAVTEIKAGRRQIKADVDGIVNLSYGKKSMSKEALVENLKVVCGLLNKKKPTDLKGDYVKSIHVTTTMGKSLQVSRKVMV